MIKHKIISKLLNLSIISVAIIPLVTVISCGKKDAVPKPTPPLPKPKIEVNPYALDYFSSSKKIWTNDYCVSNSNFFKSSSKIISLSNGRFVFLGGRKIAMSEHNVRFLRCLETKWDPLFNFSHQILKEYNPVTSFHFYDLLKAKQEDSFIYIQNMNNMYYVTLPKFKTIKWATYKKINLNYKFPKGTSKCEMKLILHGKWKDSYLLKTDKGIYRIIKTQKSWQTIVLKENNLDLTRTYHFNNSFKELENGDFIIYIDGNLSLLKQPVLPKSSFEIIKISSKKDFKTITNIKYINNKIIIVTNNSKIWILNTKLMEIKLYFSIKGIIDIHNYESNILLTTTSGIKIIYKNVKEIIDQEPTWLDKVSKGNFYQMIDNDKKILIMKTLVKSSSKKAKNFAINLPLVEGEIQVENNTLFWKI